MLIWILSALALHLVHVYLPAILFLPSEGVMTHVGSRDRLPEPSFLVSRARRALANYQENLPVFLALALLTYVQPGVDMASAVLGAQIFVVARAAYLVLYLISVPFTRSIAFLVGFGGLILMLFALL